jgi:hypothetical protein
MAAGEHEPQALVGDGAERLGVLVGLGAADRGQALEVGRALTAAGVPPQPVDGAVAGADGDPGSRVGGHAAGRPALQRDEERVLDGLLGAVEVAERPRERGDRLPRLAPEQAIGDDGRVAQVRAPSDCVWASSLPPAS